MKSLPPSKINSTKLLGGSSFSTKKTLVDSNKLLLSGSTKKTAVSSKKLETLGENDFSIIKKQVFQIKNLVTNITLSKKNEQKRKQKEQEQEKFEGTEKKLEKNKPKETGIKLPSTPKLGFLDRIKNFLFNTFLGFIAVRLIEHLPKLIGVAKFLGGTLDFLTSVGGILLNGLVTFVEKGYEVADFTRKQLRNFGGEGAVEKFDALNKAFENIIFAAIAASLALGNLGSGGEKGGGPGGKPARRGFDTTGRRVGVNTQKRFAEKYGRDEFIKRFGKDNLKNLPKSMQRSALTKFGRKAVVGALGKGGTKTALKVVAPLVRNIPLIGGIMEFVLSWMSGDPVGKAAFKGVGAGLGTWIGGALGSLIPIPGVGTAIGMWLGSAGGSKLGEVIYDKIFNSKDSLQKPQEGIKAKGGGLVPSTRGGKSVSSAPKRTLKKKKKSTRSLSFIPTKIKPGKSTGGEDKIQSVFPNPEKEWWDPLGVFSGKTQEEPQQKKSTEKISNPQEFLLESNDVLGKSNSFGPFFTLALKSVLGDKPNKLDYLKVGQGLNSWMQGVFKTGPLGFAGGGEVDAKQFFGGEDYTQVIAKSVEDSVSKEIDTTIRNLKDELSLRKPVGKDEMTQENIRKGTGGGGGDGGGGGGYDDSPHGTPGPAVQATSGFNPGKGDKTKKIFLHWSAGSHNQNFSNYHTTFLGNGRAVRNRGYGVDGTEHTAGANTNSVGLAIAAMGGKGVNENKFGSFPPTSAQVSAMALEAARLAVAWGWDESTIEKNVRTHGEWERYATKSGILPGRPQRWDLDKLRQSDPTNSGGDKLRKMIKSYFKKLKAGATVDSSGKVISKTTGSPLAQMSLETAMEMTEPGSESGARISGGTADFWALAAISALEGINAQGEADVAQSIYNRAAAGVFPGGKSIHGIITKDEVQYSPVKESNPALWRAIKDKESAIKAVASHRNGGANASKKLESAAKNIKNPALQAEAAKFVGGRTDFNSLGVYGSDPPGAISVVKRNGHRFGFWVGSGSKNYGRSNPKAAGVPSLGASVSSTGGSGSVNQSGLPPLPPTGTMKGQNYGDSRDGGARKHAGQDYDAPNNGTFYSRIGGEVIYSANAGGGYGNIVDIYNRSLGITERIAEGTSNFVRLGQTVSAGTRVQQGTDQTGVFHYEIRKGKATRSGSFEGTIDPKKFLSGSRFHGGEITKEGVYNLHKGEVVIDFDTRKLFGIDLLMDLNSVENKTQLIAKVPSIIEKLKSISGYTDYENPNQEPQIVYIEVPVEVPVLMGSGSGGSIFIAGGGENNNNGMKATLAQVG